MTKQPTIGIIGGTGKMGTFFRHQFEMDGIKVLIAGRNTELSYQELCRQSDIVIVSVPYNKTAEIIQEILSDLKKDSLLVDFSSLKTNTMDEMAKSNSAFCGIHPLFGPLTSSLEGQTIVFCNGKDNDWVNFLENFFKQKKAKVIEMSAKEHDQQMALIQGLVHTLNIVFAETLANSNVTLNKELTTPVFRLQQLVTARIFGQNADLYENITMENPLFQPILKSLQKNLTDLSEAIVKKR